MDSALFDSQTGKAFQRETEGLFDTNMQNHIIFVYKANWMGFIYTFLQRVLYFNI